MVETLVPPPSVCPPLQIVLEWTGFLRRPAWVASQSFNMVVSSDFVGAIYTAASGVLGAKRWAMVSAICPGHASAGVTVFSRASDLVDPVGETKIRGWWE